MDDWTETDYTEPNGVPSNVEVMKSYLGDYFNCDRSVTTDNLSRAKQLLGISDSTYNSLLQEFKPTFEPEPDPLALDYGLSSLSDLLGL